MFLLVDLDSWRSHSYVYFEKRRVLEGKKKTAARIRNEAEHAHGMPLQEAPRYVWVKT